MEKSNILWGGIQKNVVEKFCLDYSGYPHYHSRNFLNRGRGVRKNFVYLHKIHIWTIIK